MNNITRISKHEYEELVEFLLSFSIEELKAEVTSRRCKE
jgi:hypothetical protein